MERFFATCPRGLELILADELRGLKAEKVHAVGGGVQFVGDFFLCYRVNLESRLASRVLWQVATGHYRSEDDIYRASYALGSTRRARSESMFLQSRARSRASILLR
jgi:putative N6-adenine-specific DNA methylase